MKLEIRHKTVKRRVNWYDPISSFEDVARFQELYGEDWIYRVHGVKSKANELIKEVSTKYFQNN